MKTQWKYTRSNHLVNCSACERKSTGIHLNSLNNHTLCDSCYIEKYIPLDHLKPITQYPHRVSVSPVEYLWGQAEKGLGWIEKRFSGLVKELIKKPIFN